MKATERMISYLLENANPSIALRVREEILGETIPAEERAHLCEEIHGEKIVQSIAECQKESGWLGNGYHGSNSNAGRYENQEVGTKYLAEKGLGKNDPVLRRAMLAYRDLPFDDPCYRHSVNYFDVFRNAANGGNLFRCACIARAGYADDIDIEPQIQLSLDSFKRVLEVDSILDITRPMKNGTVRVFNDPEKWPCHYHLDILAHTDSWRTPENIDMLAESVKKMMKTDRPELIGLGAASWFGHITSTCGCFPSQGLDVKRRENGKEVYDIEHFIWFVRCGLVPKIQRLADEAGEIAKAVNQDGVAEIPIGPSFRAWCPYFGQSLETDWKFRKKRNSDITFRALEVLHYSGINA